jgi:hypothetical protein
MHRYIRVITQSFAIAISAIMITSGPAFAKESAVHPLFTHSFFTNSLFPSLITNEIIHVPFFIEDSNHEPPAVANTPVFEARAHNPIMTPSGHQVTLGEFNQPSGTAWVNCNISGTRVHLSLHGLIPNGVYTVWNLTFKSPGFQGTIESLMNNVIGIGPIGPNTGSKNSFKASAFGNAIITATTPVGSLAAEGAKDSFGSILQCALAQEFEWHVIGAYHLDGQTHGADLGPDGTAVEQFAFILKH